MAARRSGRGWARGHAEDAGQRGRLGPPELAFIAARGDTCSSRHDQARSHKDERRNYVIAVQPGQMADKPLYDVGAGL